MATEFELPSSRNAKLSEALRAYRFRGDFWPARQKILEALASQPQAGYDPKNDPLLLRLHCAASLTFHELGEYDRAQEFVLPFGAPVQYEVLRLLNETGRSAAGEAALPKMKSGEEELWHARAWLLQTCGVAAYRMSKFESAREYLTDAISLSTLLLRQAVERRKDRPGRGTGMADLPGVLERTTMLATKYFWRGIVDTDANRFARAEQDFLMGLELIATELKGPQTDKEAGDQPGAAEYVQFANYLTARILLGLGILKFHFGGLRDARAHLMTAMTLLSRDSKDEIRKLRAKALLLSVERLEKHDDSVALREILAKLERIAEDFNPVESVSPLRHGRYFAATKCTIARVHLHLADLFPQHESMEQNVAASENARDLNAVLTIVDDARVRAYGSIGDRLELDNLKTRALRKLGRHEEAVKWGEIVLGHPALENHPLVHVQALISLAHTHYDWWDKKGNTNALNEALRRMLEAEALSRDNPRFCAVCNLHLANISKAQGQGQAAESYFQRWRLWEAIVQASWVHKFSKEVRAKLDAATEGFEISTSKVPDEKAYDTLEKLLRKFLLEKVVAGRTVDDQASRLGISRQTLYAWRRALDDRGREK